MIKLLKSLPVIALLLISIPAFAGSCPKDMKAIDAALAENPSVSSSEMDRIKELRELGEAQHKSGKHADSVASLHEAMKLLGIK
jgi:hypothetical protein